MTTEAKLSADQRKTNEWQLLTKVNGHPIIVGKGGVNTIFYKFGDRERRVCYPDQILDRLQELAAQRCDGYLVVDPKSDDKDGTWCWRLADAQKMLAKRCRIYSITGTERQLVFTASDSVNGLIWVPHG